MRIFQQDWGIETAGWSIDFEDGILTLCPADVDAALQITCLRKRTGSVSGDELRSFAAERLPVNVSAVEVTNGAFSGYYGEYVADETYWRNWWLAHGNVHLFVTYNTAPEHREHHLEVVDWMLCSLVAEGRTRKHEE